MKRHPMQVSSNMPWIVAAVQREIENVFHYEHDEACTLEGLESRTLMSVSPADAPMLVVPDHGAIAKAVHVVGSAKVQPIARSAPVAIKPKAKAPVKAVHVTPKVKAKAPAKLHTSATPLTLSKPTSLSATITTPTDVKLTWNAGDAKAAGYVILRATDRVHFTQLAKLTGTSATTYADTSAASFHSYSYEVQEYNGATTSVASAVATATTPLATPVGLTAVATAPNAVQISWTINEPLASGYTVLRSSDGINFTPIAQLTAIKIGTYADTTVHSGSPYTYEVRAVNGRNMSAVSSPARVVTPLIAPSGLLASYQSGAVYIAWTGHDSAAAGYYVLRLNSDGKTYTQIANVTGAAAAGYVDTGVVTGRSYTYKIQAYGAGSMSAMTAVATIITPLTAPSALNAAVTGTSSVTLAWTDNDADAIGYYILRSTDGVHFSTLSSVVGVAANGYVDKTAASGTSYQYEVEAFANAIVSNPAPMAAVALPLATPGAVVATATSPGSVQLTWTMSDPLATGYNVLRASSGGSFSQVAAVSGKTTLAWTDTSVSSGASYSYKVQAVNGSNTSSISAAVTAITPLIMPSGLTSTVMGSNVYLSWSGTDPNATGYTIFRLDSNAHFTQIATVTDGATAFTDPNTHTGMTYSYQMRAYNSIAVSAMTAATTLSIPLAAPTGLAATTNSATTVSLAWTDNDMNAADYLVLRGTDNVHFTQIDKQTSASATTYTDTTGTSGQTYFYEVEANTGAALSPASASASATTLLATPAALTAVANGPTSVQLTWTNNEPQATGYDIMRSADGINFSQIAQLNSGRTTTYTDLTAASAMAYTYAVKAISATNQSVLSATANVKTPLAAPTALTASMAGGSAQLVWTDNDSSATGYYILRASNVNTFVQIANVSGTSVHTYADALLVSGSTYSYEVQAYNANVTSAISAAASLNAPLAAPSGLAMTNTTAASVQMTWTDNDTNAAGYYILRSTNGGSFSLIATLAIPSTATYTDTQVGSGRSYSYEVEAYAGTSTSAPSNVVAVSTPLATPISLTATSVGAYVGLAWVGKDAGATGYNILRSNDNVTFIRLTQVTGVATGTYVDTTVAASQTYYYQVQAYGTSTSSSVSTAATVSTPAGGTTTGVSVTTRFGNELVITAAGATDSVSISQSGSILTITGDSQTFTDAVPAAGVFVYTRGGSDSINIASTVVAQTTVDSIDGAPTVITTAGANVHAWIDSTDTLIGTATTHSVASFVGGVSKAFGASVANPKDAGLTTTANLSLFGTGPVAGDVNQGEAGDCYFLSSLAAFAGESPATLTNSAVDLGDGTYAVQFISRGSPVYVRVSNQFSTGYFDGFDYAHPGANNTIWAMVMEKAFCDFRTGANTYDSINSGYMNEVYTDFGVNSTFVIPSAFNDTTLFNQLSSDLANGEAVTFGTQNAPNLVSDHAYTLVSVSVVNGVNHYVVRNPWGESGDSLENSLGYATLTYAQLVANFVEGVAATPS